MSVMAGMMLSMGSHYFEIVARPALMMVKFYLALSQTLWLSLPSFLKAHALVIPSGDTPASCAQYSVDGRVY